MSITIKKIAQLAGVSRGTVDRALNGREGVNPAVAQKIQDIAKLYGYKPNRVAKALATRNRNTSIGVLVNASGNVFFDDVLLGIREYAEEMADFGVALWLKTISGYDANKQIEGIKELVAQGIDALLLTPINDVQVVALLQELIHEKNIPVVSCNTDIEGVDKLCYVGCDYYKSGSTASGLMGSITQGEAKVGVIAGSRKILGHNLREAGFIDTARQDYPNMRVLRAVENHDSDEISFQVVQEILREFDELDAVCFLGGGVQGGMKALIESGRVSRTRVVAFDYTPVTEEYMKRGMIAGVICQQPYEQGYRAMKVLFDYLIAGITPAEPQNLTELFIKTKYCS